MALTIANTFVIDSATGARVASFTVTFDNVYPTGGEILDISSWFQGSPDVYVAGDDGVVVQHNRGTSAAGLLLAYEAGADGAALDQVANACDLSAVITKVLVIGNKAIA